MHRGSTLFPLMHHGWLAWLTGDLLAFGSAGVGAFLGGAKSAFDEKLKEWTGKDSVEEYLSDLLDDFLPDASTYEEARERLDELVENFKEFGEQVVAEIGDVVGDILDTGAVPSTTDGGLGETHDIFTPESGAPQAPTGDFPGVGGPGTGMNRNTEGPSYETPPSGGGGGGGGSTTPLGQTSPEPPATGAAPSQPTFDDLGLDPDGGAFYEYHPGDGEVVITYADGTTEVRPGP